VVLAVDFVAGPYFHFPILFIIPVSLAAWHSGFPAGAAFAIGLPITRFIYHFVWENGDPYLAAAANLILRESVLVAFAYLVARTARQTRELEREVNVLTGILPTCAHCKKIRDNDNQWHQIEAFISSKSDVRFSHGFCPECARKHYGPYLPDSLKQPG
jgi:hypothetical protein